MLELSFHVRSFIICIIFAEVVARESSNLPATAGGESAISSHGEEALDAPSLETHEATAGGPSSDVLPLSKAVRTFTAAPCDYFSKDYIKASALLDKFFIVNRKVLFLYLILDIIVNIIGL